MCIRDRFNANAPASVAKGFVWDNADVINEVTSCTNVLNKYVKALQSGALNPETDLGKFNQELRDAGLDTIIQDKPVSYTHLALPGDIVQLHLF